MRFSALFAAAAALVTASAKIAFTSVPGDSVTVGQSFTLKWDGEDPSAPVTITLKMGDPNDLTTVDLITGNAQGGSYTWTPGTNLVNGQNYALEISQGTGFDETNYSGEFAITGGAASSSVSSASGTASGTTYSMVAVTMTSGNATFVTSHSMYAAATGSGTGVPYPKNATTTHASSSSTPVSVTTGGIIVTATTSVAGPSTSAAPSASTSAAAAAAFKPVGGFAAALLGLIALL